MSNMSSTSFLNIKLTLVIYEFSFCQYNFTGEIFKKGKVMNVLITNTSRCKMGPIFSALHHIYSCSDYR